MIDLMKLVMEARNDNGGITVGGARRASGGTDYGANAPAADDAQGDPATDPTDATDYGAGAPQADEGGPQAPAGGGATGEGGPPPAGGGITVGGPEGGGAQGDDQGDQATDYGAGAPGMDDPGSAGGGGGDNPDGGAALANDAGPGGGPAGNPDEGEAGGGDFGSEGGGEFGEGGQGDGSSDVDSLDVNKEMGGESNEEELKRKQLASVLLLKSFIRLYGMIGSTIKKINESRKNSLLSTVTYNQAKKNLIDLEQLVFKYITLTYDSSPPDMNSYNFNYFMEIFNWNIEMIEKVHKIEEKARIKKEKSTKSSKK
jgi:hypothetical protein